MKTKLGEILYLSQQDVIAAGGLDMSAAVSQMELALFLFDKGECVHPSKSILRWSDDPNVENTRGRINFLSAYVGGSINALGMKWIGSFPNNRGTVKLPRATAIIVLNDPETGVPLAVLEGSIISADRGLPGRALRDSRCIAYANARLRWREVSSCVFRTTAKYSSDM